MSSWISFRVSETMEPKALPELSLYFVRFEVISSNGIEPELFVLSVETNGFSSVATVPDIELYPTTPEEALDEGLNFYRATTFTVSFTSKEKAANFVSNTKTRLHVVVNDWSADVAVIFGGDETFVYTSTT